MKIIMKFSGIIIVIYFGSSILFPYGQIRPEKKVETILDSLPIKFEIPKYEHPTFKLPKWSGLLLAMVRTLRWKQIKEQFYEDPNSISDDELIKDIIKLSNYNHYNQEINFELNRDDFLSDQKDQE